MKNEYLRNLVTFLVLATLWVGLRFIRNDFRPEPRLEPRPHLQFNATGRPLQVMPRLDGYKVNP